MSQMVKVRVLKAVQIAAETVHGRPLIPGTEDMLPSGLAEELAWEGYVGLIDADDRLPMADAAEDARLAPTAPEHPEVPEGWRMLSWPEMRALAAKVSDAPVRTKDDAEAAILAEIGRRGG